MSEKRQIICGHCGSADVKRDAWAVWDTDTQDWVLGSVFDDGHCEVCEGESNLEELALKEWFAALNKTRELNGFDYQARATPDQLYEAVVMSAGVDVWRADKDRWGEPFHDAAEALDAARKAIIKEEIA